MSVNIPEHFVSHFSTNVELLLQQKVSKLRDLFNSGSHEVKQASPVNQFGAIDAQTPAGRFAPKNRTDAPAARRWVFPQDKEIDQLLDDFDMLRLIEDPKGPYALNASYAIGRSYDDALIAAALGTANTGETGTGTEAFDTTNYQVGVDFAASSDVGLTVAKLIEAKRMMRGAEVDLENDPLTLIISENQEADLLNQIEVVSTDFNAKPVLVDGRITRFLDFNIIVSTRLDVATAHRSCIAFAKSGMYLGMWRDMQTRVSVRNDLSGEPWDLYTNATYGATRLEQGKVVEILAQE
jgi:hypothetical protein